MPETSLVLSADWRIHERLQVGTRARYVGKQAFQPANATRTDAFAAFDFSLLTQLDRKRAWELQLGIDDAFDASVDTRLGADPGPFMRFGLRHHF